MPYNGSLEDLKAQVTLHQREGDGFEEGPVPSFSSNSGEHINVWPPSGELQRKAHPKGSRELEDRLPMAERTL
jgi:hypothetical protein